MKHFLMLMMILFCTIRVALSQQQFGLKGGVNIADQKKSSSYSTNSRAHQKRYYYGYQAGVYYKKSICKNWSASSELNFNVVGSTMGYQTETMIMENRYDYFNYKFGYIELPVMVGYHIYKLYFSLGPALSYKVFSKITSFENMRGTNISYHRKTDVSANLLAGYRITKQTDLNLRYSYGIRNIEEEGAYNFSCQNRFLNLSLLYSFNGK